MRPNLAARAGRWSAAHWKTATFGWLALVVVAVMAGNAVGTVKLTDVENTSGENARAQRILDDAHIRGSATERVLIASSRVGATSPAFRRAVRDVRTTLASRPQVARLQPTAISANGHAALVAFDMRGDPETAQDRVQPLLNAVARVQLANPGLRIEEIGDASAPHALDKQIQNDFQRAERLSVPLTFLILLFAFGAFVAAGLPVLLALSAVIASIGLSAIASHVAHATDTISSIILLMGMAVGVDYSLFYVQRARAERATGQASPTRSPRRGDVRSCGVVSGATVMIAMAGMMLAGSKTFTSLGIGAIIVVAMAMIGSLTVLPALLARLGDRVDRGIVSVVAAGAMGVIRRRRGSSCGCATAARCSRGPRAAVASRVSGPPCCAARCAIRRSPRRPRSAARRTRAAGAGHAPAAAAVQRPAPAARGRQDLRRHEQGVPRHTCAGDGRRRAPDVTAPSVRHALADLRQRRWPPASCTPRSARRSTPAARSRWSTSHCRAPARTGVDRGAQDAAPTVVPDALGALPGARYAVTGETAGNHDFTSTMRATPRTCSRSCSGWRSCCCCSRSARS